MSFMEILEEFVRSKQFKLAVLTSLLTGASTFATAIISYIASER